MLNRNTSWRALLGVGAEGFVGKQTSYTDSTDYEGFVADAAEGEIGIFKVSDLSAYGGSAAASDTDEIFVAMKRDGLIEKTSTFKLGTASGTRAAYAAAVAQVSKVTLDGTPVKGNFYQLKVQDLSIAYQPFPTWDYHYVAKAGDTKGDVASALADLINDDTNVTNKDTDPIVSAVAGQGVVSATITSGGSSYTSAPTIAFSGGGGTGAAATATVDSGAVTAITITNAGSGYTSAPTIAFSGGAGSGAAATAVIAADGTISITANTKGASFQIGFSKDILEDLDATLTRTATPSWGSGIYEQVAELERYLAVRDGVTTQYPQEGVRPEEYGEPTWFATSGAQYTSYLFTVEATEDSPTPIEKHFIRKQIIIVVPSNGTNPDTEVKKVLGF